MAQVLYKMGVKVELKIKGLVERSYLGILTLHSRTNASPPYQRSLEVHSLKKGNEESLD